MVSLQCWSLQVLGVLRVGSIGFMASRRSLNGMGTASTVPPIRDGGRTRWIEDQEAYYPTVLPGKSKNLKKGGSFVCGFYQKE